MPIPLYEQACFPALGLGQVHKMVVVILVLAFASGSASIDSPHLAAASSAALPAAAPYAAASSDAALAPVETIEEAGRCCCGEQLVARQRAEAPHVLLARAGAGQPLHVARVKPATCRPGHKEGGVSARVWRERGADEAPWASGQGTRRGGWQREVAGARPARLYTAHT